MVSERRVAVGSVHLLHFSYTGFIHLDRRVSFVIEIAPSGYTGNDAVVGPCFEAACAGCCE